MVRQLKSEAIVLKKRNLPSKDIIITFFTEEFGLIRAFAKGIKKITSRRLPHAQTANLLDIMVQKKDERFYLAETSLISAFSKIKKNAKKMAVVYFLFFVIDRLLPENQKEDKIYAITKKFLVDLSNSLHFSEEKLEDYLYQILSFLGYIQKKLPLAKQRSIISELVGEEIPLFSI